MKHFISTNGSNKLISLIMEQIQKKQDVGMEELTDQDVKDIWDGTYLTDEEKEALYQEMVSNLTQQFNTAKTEIQNALQGIESTSITNDESASSALLDTTVQNVMNSYEGIKWSSTHSTTPAVPDVAGSMNYSVKLELYWDRNGVVNDSASSVDHLEETVTMNYIIAALPHVYTDSEINLTITPYTEAGDPSNMFIEQKLFKFNLFKDENTNIPESYLIALYPDGNTLGTLKDYNDQTVTNIKAAQWLEVANYCGMLSAYYDSCDKEFPLSLSITNQYATECQINMTNFITNSSYGEIPSYIDIYVKPIGSQISPDCTWRTARINL